MGTKDGLVGDPGCAAARDEGSVGLEAHATAELELGATNAARLVWSKSGMSVPPTGSFADCDTVSEGRLYRLLKNSDLPVLRRRLKPTQIVNKELIGTTKVVP